ncbi:MAG: restriction endonuclease subunit S [Anaerolineae bacterium]
MSHIEDIRPKDISDSRDIPGIAKALNEFEEWTRTQQIESGSISWTVPIGTLRIDNFTAIRYLPSDLSRYEELIPSYPMVPLKQVAKLTKRGVRIKLDEEGNLPVIGPGAIRPMILDASNIESTTEDNLPSRPVTVKAGDIVLNNIGMHLGSVAMIDEDVAGSYISQHVLLIRPDTSRILPEYFAAALNSDYVRPQIERRATGSIMPALSVSRLTDITIPLPDLATQQRIVAAIVRARDDLAQKREQLERAEARFENMIRRLSSGIEVEE